MIYGRLEDLAGLLEAVPGGTAVNEFLITAYEDGIKPGKYEILDDIVFISVEDYKTCPEEEKLWEAHEVYADIQFIISGRERIGFGDFKDMKPVSEYDSDKDIAFYRGEGPFQEMNPGEFLILFPGETHKPCVMTGSSPENVRKAVVKIRGLHKF